MSDKGPTLDQEPMVVSDEDIVREALEVIDPDTTPVEVVLKLTEDEFRVINQSMAAALFAYFPQLWMANAQEERHRMGMMQMFTVLADRAMVMFNEAQAIQLREKLAQGVKDFYAQKGLDFEEQQGKLVEDLKETFGLEIRNVPATEEGEASVHEVPSPSWHPAEAEASGGSVGVARESEDVAGADVPGVPAADTAGDGPKTPDLS